MRFWIQAGNPVSLQLCGKTSADLSEAIEMVFPMTTEDAILVWNNSYIPISYKYDLSVMIDDLLPLLAEVLGNSSGRYLANFGSNTFSAEWDLVWAKDMLSISAQWQSVAGKLEVVASDCGDVEVATDNFLSEWKEVLSRVITAVQKSSLSIADEESYERLVKIESAIKRKGRLYQIS